MWERFFLILSLTILVLSGVLFLSSAADHLFHFPLNEHFLEIRTYIGKFVLGLSIIFAILNIRFTNHPMYEYWLPIILGCVTGVVFSF